MFKALLTTLEISLCTIVCLSTSPLQAQVTSDETTDTQIEQNGNVTEITGGETRGSNLFHSFQDFSVGGGNEAFFNNAENISDIFSRVTGGNISNIDGLIRANGSANLFLINPAGIIFGEGARLDIGGSFYGSSASSILFEDGSFSAVDNLEQPILTINAPIGLNFRDEPGDIVNRSIVQNSDEEVIGLEVASGNDITLVGGNLNFEGGNLTAPGGNIFLSGLDRAGTVDLNENGSLSVTEGQTLANIALTNAADINVIGTGGGNINIDARNLSLAAGEFGSSSILAGITADSTSIEAQAGDININVAENTTINNSGIGNQVFPEGVGNSGNIALDTGSLSLINGGAVDASTFGSGNAGSVNITARGNIAADGENSQGSLSGITSGVAEGAQGDGGGVTISTTNLNLTDGGRVGASTLGSGNAGSVNITARGDIAVDGESDRIPSGITSRVAEDAEGDGGGVTISATNLNLTNGGQVGASTLGSGNAGSVNITAKGNIAADGESDRIPSGITSEVRPDAQGDGGSVNISATNLNLTNGGQVGASTLGSGNAGEVIVTTTGNITADGSNSQGFASGITSGVNPGAQGDGGGVTISTTNLNLTNGGQVAAGALGSGNAGSVNVTARGDIAVDGSDSQGFPSGITSGVNPGAGDAGGVTISTANLNLTNGGRVAANTSGTGDAGSVNVTARGDITADGENSRGFPSGIKSVVNTGAEGDAGGVTIRATNLNLTNGGEVDASTFGTGNAAEVNVTARGDITADGSNSQGFPSGITSGVRQGGQGDAGGVTISTTNLNLTNGGKVDASTFDTGNANDVTIDAGESIFINGSIARFRSGISANALNESGNGGNVSINTGSLTIANGGTIEATNFDNIGGDDSPGLGRPGNIDITANSLDLIDNARIEAATQFEREESGIINLFVAEDITVENNSFISAQARGDANGGNLSIDARFVVAFPSNGTGNDLVAAADRGTGGNITLDAEQLFGFVEGIALDRGNNTFLSNSTNDLDVSGNVNGSLNITTTNIDPLQGAIELPVNIVQPSETTQQACASNREAEAKNGLDIVGKGGVPPAPELPLNSLNTVSNGETNPTSDIPAPIETSKGKIQLARGIEVTPDGVIRLTAYRTNAAWRLPPSHSRCRIGEAD